MVKRDQLTFILTVAVVAIIIYVATITPDHMNVLEYICDLVGIPADAGGNLIIPRDVVVAVGDRT